MWFLIHDESGTTKDMEIIATMKDKMQLTDVLGRELACAFGLCTWPWIWLVYLAYVIRM